MNEERYDKIKEVAKEYSDKLNDVLSFAIDMAYLQNWYQDSIDETKKPIWTDKHIEELFNDFYLIPKR